MTLALLGRPKSTEAQPPQSVRELVIHWMQEWIWRGFPTDEACVKTIAEVRAAGLVEEFLDELGPIACQEFWRRGQREARNGHIVEVPSHDIEDSDDAEGEPIAVPATHADPRSPARILAGTRVESLFDWMMVRIAGKWRSIGDLRRDDAEAIAAGYAKRKAAMADKEVVWTRIAEGLGEQTVRERYTEDEIRALLRGAAP